MQVNIALLTVTDTRTIDTDKSGAILVKKIKEQNHNLVDRKIAKHKKKEIKRFQTIVCLRVKILLHKPWVWNQLNMELKV